MQLSAIFLGSASLIALMSPFLGSIGASYRLFADPSSYADSEGWLQLVFGLVQVILGLILFSFIISVLSASLEQLIDRIKGGALPFRKSGHLLVINSNAKLPLLLDEVNLRARRMGKATDVVVLLPSRDAVDGFTAQLDQSRWDELEIYVRQGDLMNFETYRNLGVMDALGVVILADGTQETSFLSDNLNLKVLATLCNEQVFLDHLSNRQREHRPVKFSIELANELYGREIALALTQAEGGSLVSVVSPAEVIGSVLSRSIIDIVYYKVYFEILSFHGHTVQFISPTGFAANGLTPGLTFEQISLGFQGCSLAGFSRTEKDGRLNMMLCPLGETLKAGDWLLIITKDVGRVRFEPHAAGIGKPSPEIVPPREILARRLCIIGDAWPVKNLESFLDEESRRHLHEANFVFETVEQYFAPDFTRRLRTENFDNIVINLDDALGFRLTLHLISACAEGDPFLAKIVTVLTDPVIEGLLNRNSRYRNTVVSHKLAAKYMAQLSFQKNLEQFYAELARPEGAEFNLLDVGTHIPRELLTSRRKLAELLIAHGMVYVAAIGADKEVDFESDEVRDARQILVLSHGGG